MQEQERQLTVCLSPDAYIAARVTQRLLDAGCEPRRAEAVGRKVARSYARAREARLTTCRPLPDRQTEGTV